MSGVNVLIIEDELPIQRMLVGILAELRPDWEIAAQMTSVAETLDYLQNEKEPDIILSDIQLSDGVSFDIFRKHPVKTPIIFITAYDEYAIQAFDVFSIDYLLKPIKRDRLEKAIEKFEEVSLEHHLPAKPFDLGTVVEAIQQGQKKYRSRFLIQHGEDYYRLDVSEIAYVYTTNKISFARTFEGKEHILDQSLEKLEKQLDPKNFFRVNRQVIINSAAIVKVRSYFNGKLKLVTNPQFSEELVASREKSKLLKEWLNG